MKKTILILVSISVLFVILSGCNGFPIIPVSIEGRIALFEDELNKDDRSEVYTHFHPETGSYINIKPHGYYEDTPLATEYIPFNITITNEPVDIGGGQQQVDAIMYREDSTLDDPCIFIMEMDGDDWFIREFTLDPDGVPFQISKIGDAGM